MREDEIRTPVLDQLIEIHPVAGRLHGKAGLRRLTGQVAAQGVGIVPEIALLENLPLGIHLGHIGRLLVEINPNILGHGCTSWVSGCCATPHGSAPVTSEHTPKRGPLRRPSSPPGWCSRFHAIRLDY